MERRWSEGKAELLWHFFGSGVETDILSVSALFPTKKVGLAWNWSRSVAQSNESNWLGVVLIGAGARLWDGKRVSRLRRHPFLLYEVVLFDSVAQVGDETQHEDERDGQDGSVELLGQGREGHDGCIEEHEQLEADEPAIAAAQTDGEVDEERRGPEDVEVGLGAVVRGAEPEEEYE